LIVSSEKFSIELLVLFLDIRFSAFAMAEFPICITPSQRELARMTEEERLTALLQVKERKKAVKAKPKKILGGPLMVNRMKMWRQHRERVKEAISTVDAEAPNFQAARITGVNNLRDEAQVFMKRTKANIQLLVEISRTMRTHGAINPFRYEVVHAVSSVPLALLSLEQLERDNRDFGRRIMEVHSEVDSGLSDKRLLEGRNAARVAPLELPPQAMAKYEAFSAPTSEPCRCSLLELQQLQSGTQSRRAERRGAKVVSDTWTDGGDQQTFACHILQPATPLLTCSCVSHANG